VSVEEKLGEAKKQHRRSSSCPADLQVTENFNSVLCGLVDAHVPSTHSFLHPAVTRKPAHTHSHPSEHRLVMVSDWTIQVIFRKQHLCYIGNLLATVMQCALSLSGNNFFILVLLAHSIQIVCIVLSPEIKYLFLCLCLFGKHCVCLFGCSIDLYLKYFANVWTFYIRLFTVAIFLRLYSK
jgi:hypothetical protein